MHIAHHVVSITRYFFAMLKNTSVRIKSDLGPSLIIGGQIFKMEKGEGKNYVEMCGLKRRVVILPHFCKNPQKLPVWKITNNNIK